MSAPAVALHVCATTWSSRSLTDGFVPDARVRKLPGGEDGVPACLLEGEKPWWVKVDGGYQIRSYLKFNPSKEKVLAEREAAKERMKAVRSHDVRPNEHKNGAANTARSSTPPVSRIPDTHIPDTHTPLPPLPSNGKVQDAATSRAKSPAAWWEDFIGTYPKRSGDRKASKGREIFLRLAKTVDPALMLEGAGRYAKWCEATQKTRTELVQQIPTWLNGKSWLEPWEIEGKVSGVTARTYAPEECEIP